MSYIAMFEKTGIKTLSPLAAFVLTLLDGKNSLESILQLSQNSFDCTEADIRMIISDVS